MQEFMRLKSFSMTNILSPNLTWARLSLSYHGSVRGFQMVPLVILPMVHHWLNNGTIGLSLVPLALPLVPMVLPIAPLVEP